MTLEEIKQKAKIGKLKLEDLEVEDILKFGSEGFINNELAKCFHISKEDIRKIRKAKNITDSYYEDCIRNIIVLIDTLKEKYPTLIGELLNSIVIGMLLGLESVRGEQYDYLNKVQKIDWAHMDTKKEIKERKIDVEYRLKLLNKMQLMSYIEKYIQNMELNLQDIPTSHSIYEEEFLPKRKPKKEAKSSTVQAYPRDKKVAKRALAKANYKCALNPEHTTFISRSTGKKYMEPHHLIPLDFYDLFEYSLDVESNIVCLCSNCHNELHYGVNYKELLKKLYEERKESLKKCGIEISSVEVLYSMYENRLDKEKIKN